MKKIYCYLVLVFLGMAMNVQAHRLWILPHETIKAGNPGPEVWVTFDLAVSNDIFQIDHAAPKLHDPIVVLLPSGRAQEPQNFFTGKLRSSFDVNLVEEGTYKIFTASSGLQARWETTAGKKGFWPERGAKGNPSELKNVVPSDAKNIEVTQSSRRTEAFVTLGKPNAIVLTPSNQGLEMLPITHPADFALGEKAKLKFLMDGIPAVGAKVTLVRDGARYRNAPEEQNFETDKNGIIEIQWAAAGAYWLGATYKDSQAKLPATQRSASYSLCFEVLN